MITRFVAGAGVVLLSFLFLSALVMTSPTAEVVDTPRAARSIIVLEAQQADVSRHFNGYGVAEAVEHADVPARVASTVVELPRESRAGNPVNVGQVIAILDDTDFREEATISAQKVANIESQLAALGVEQEAAVDRRDLAQEEVTLAERELGRVQEAAAREAAHPREVDQVRQALIAKQTALVTARQAVDQMQTSRSQLMAQQRSEEAAQRLAMQRIERCRILSPLAGFIESVDITVGENLLVGARVARVVDPTLIEVPLRLSAASRSEVALGDTVLLHATGSSNVTWEAKVVRIAPEDDPMTRTTTVYVEVEQEPAGGDYLAPGMFVRGEVTSTSTNRSWVVPRRAVLNDRLLFVRDGLIKSVPVKIEYAVSGDFASFNIPDRDWLVLETPLSEGEQIVVNPTRSLTDGLQVNPVLATGELTSAIQDSDGGLELEEDTAQ